MPLPQFISNLFGKGAGNIVESIGNVADKFIQTKEEKDEFNAEMQSIVNSHSEKMAELAIEEMKIELEREKAILLDTTNARDSNVKIQESDKASWMAKNISYIIASAVTLVWAICTIYLIGKAIKVIHDEADMTAVLSLYGTITAVFMTVLTFYFGSSVSSQRKDKVIDQMTKSR